MKDEAKTKEQPMENLTALRGRYTEEAFDHYSDIGTAVNALLRLSLEDYSLEELLRKALDIILSVSSLSIETKGSIFLVEDEPEVLIQKAQKGLAEALLKECARVPFGKCLCGRAASTKRIEFADHIDERHEVRYDGMAPHGHYCVPILLAENTIGVINLYLKDGHSRIGREEEYLDSVANTLAGIIKRKRAEAELKEKDKFMESIIQSSAVATFVVDAEHKVIYWNKACEDLTGIKSEDLLGTSDHWKAFYDHPRPCVADIIIDNNFNEMSNIYKVYARSVLIPDGICAEGWYPHLGGKNRYIVFDAAPIRNGNGKLIAAIETLQDITARRQAEEKLLKTLESLRKAVGTTVQVMVSTVEKRDPYTAGHQLRVANLARAIATEMGLLLDKIDAIRMAGSIHDIGKLSIPAEILSKPTKLSEIEFSLIKEHSRQGYEILKDVESPWPLAEIVYQHHERMDGSGYPRNLKGEEIIMEARILTVADVVEAMASHRPYRPGLGIDAALNEIEQNKGIFYDNAVVDACLRLFREKGFKLEGV